MAWVQRSAEGEHKSNAGAKIRRARASDSLNSSLDAFAIVVRASPFAL
jgi:hypothetical protein